MIRRIARLVARMITDPAPATPEDFIAARQMGERLS